MTFGRHESSHYGGRGWNRTTNLSIKSRMLCQLSYASVRMGKAEKDRASQAKYSIFCAANTLSIQALRL